MNRQGVFVATSGILVLLLALFAHGARLSGAALAALTPQPLNAAPSVQATLLSRTQPSQTLLPTPSPTATPWRSEPCPRATAEPFWVEPVTSPTGHLTQTITVFLGNGEAVTVTCESGTFSQQGAFDAYTRPALVIIDLLSEATHHLKLIGKVRITGEYNGCIYGGYALSTTTDRYGEPLVIEQHPQVPVLWLPLLLIGHS